MVDLGVVVTLPWLRLGGPPPPRRLGIDGAPRPPSASPPLAGAPSAPPTAQPRVNPDAAAALVCPLDDAPPAPPPPTQCIDTAVYVDDAARFLEGLTTVALSRRWPLVALAVRVAEEAADIGREVSFQFQKPGKAELHQPGAPLAPQAACCRASSCPATTLGP